MTGCPQGHPQDFYRTLAVHVAEFFLHAKKNDPFGPDCTENAGKIKKTSASRRPDFLLWSLRIYTDMPA
jgi:hypothetical protein